jgi:hypothetical protein
MQMCQSQVRCTQQSVNHRQNQFGVLLSGKFFAEGELSVMKQRDRAVLRRSVEGEDVQEWSISA